MTARIAWLVHPPIKGSGGHRTIYSHIDILDKIGHECHIFIISPPELLHKQDPSWPEQIREYFDPSTSIPIHAWSPPIEIKFDLVIATWWMTAYDAHHINATNRVYFIQDFEPSFYPMGDYYLLSEQTYRLDFIPVTIGRWLANMMQKEFNKPAVFFEFTADSQTYHPIKQIKNEKAVCFIYQPEKSRRCPTIGFNALSIVKKQCPDVTIYTYGSTIEPGTPFPCTHLGLLTLEECNELYNRCAVGLCISSSNPSRIPFEMMAAGLPVVDIYGKNTIYDFPEQAILLAESTPESLAGAILKILNSKQLQQDMITVGTNYIRQYPATKELEQSAEIFTKILSNNHKKSTIEDPLYSSPAFRQNNKKIYHEAPQLFFPPKEEKLSQQIKSDQNKTTGWKKNFNQGVAYWLSNNRLSRALRVIATGRM